MALRSLSFSLTFSRAGGIATAMGTFGLVLIAVTYVLGTAHKL